MLCIIHLYIHVICHTCMRCWLFTILLRVDRAHGRWVRNYRRMKEWSCSELFQLWDEVYLKSTIIDDYTWCPPVASCFVGHEACVGCCIILCVPWLQWVCNKRRNFVQGGKEFRQPIRRSWRMQKLWCVSQVGWEILAETLKFKCECRRGILWKPETSGEIKYYVNRRVL